MRVAPLAVHNHFLALDEARDAARQALSSAKGRARKTRRARLDAIQAEIDALLATADTWPESAADMSYGVPAACGKRVSHYVSLIDGAWVRHD